MKRKVLFSGTMVTGWLFVLISMCWLLPQGAEAAWEWEWQKINSLGIPGIQELIENYQQKISGNSTDQAVLKTLGLAYFVLAEGNAEEYAPKAKKYLTMAYELNKKDYEVMCYLGSATTMMAKNTWNPMKKMNYVNEGAALMDKAVNKAPDNYAVRLTRGHNSRSLPDMLRRGKFAFDDFEHLAELIERDPEQSAMSVKNEVFKNLTELYSKSGEQDKADRIAHVWAQYQ